MKTKDYLQKNQPLFYELLMQSFSHHRQSHAYLLVGENTHHSAYYLAQCFICEHETLACETCNECRRILEGNYMDLITYDGLESSIKKEDIEYIQKEFNKSSLEGSEKVYILENIENSSNVAMNSLLKFLEEPTSHVHAILTTRNINKVLPTIRSRCQVIQLLPESHDSIAFSLIKDGVSQEDANVASHLFPSYQDANEIVKSDEFMNLKIAALNFIEDLYYNPNNLLLNFHISVFRDYKTEKDLIKIFINMLILALRDMFHVKHQLPIVYEKHQDLFNKLPDDKKIINKIEIVMEVLYQIDLNANLALLMDSLCYQLINN